MNWIAFLSTISVGLGVGTITASIWNAKPYVLVILFSLTVLTAAIAIGFTHA